MLAPRRARWPRRWRPRNVSPRNAKTARRGFARSSRRRRRSVNAPNAPRLFASTPPRSRGNSTICSRDWRGSKTTPARAPKKHSPRPRRRWVRVSTRRRHLRRSSRRDRRSSRRRFCPLASPSWKTACPSSPPRWWTSRPRPRRRTRRPRLILDPTPPPARTSSRPRPPRPRFDPRARRSRPRFGIYARGSRGWRAPTSRARWTGPAPWKPPPPPRSRRSTFSAKKSPSSRRAWTNVDKTPPWGWTSARTCARR